MRLAVSIKSRPFRFFSFQFKPGALEAFGCKVDFRNATGISRRLRVLPCNNTAFSIKELRYDKDMGSA